MQGVRNASSVRTRSDPRKPTHTHSLADCAERAADIV